MGRMPFFICIWMYGAEVKWQLISPAPDSIAWVASGCDTATVIGSNLPLAASPNSLTAAMRIRIGWIDTRRLGTAQRSFSPRSRIDFTAGLRVISSSGMVLTDSTALTSFGVPRVRAQIGYREVGLGKPKSTAPASIASFRLAPPASVAYTPFSSMPWSLPCFSISPNLSITMIGRLVMPNPPAILISPTSANTPTGAASNNTPNSGRAKKRRIERITVSLLERVPARRKSSSGLAQRFDALQRAHPGLAHDQRHALLVVAALEQAAREVGRLGDGRQPLRIRLIQKIVDAAEDVRAQGAVAARLRQHHAGFLEGLHEVQADADVLGADQPDHIVGMVEHLLDSGVLRAHRARHAAHA